MQRHSLGNDEFGAQSVLPLTDNHYPDGADYAQANYDNDYTYGSQWDRAAPYQLPQYPYSSSNSLEPLYALHTSAENNRTSRWQVSQLEDAILPGLFDERVHRKYRKQANFEKWFREDPDWLLGCICPADLCDMPCQWDELGGCKMFRICEIRRKYPHPIHGQRPPCNKRTRHSCDGIHDIIEPSCRSLGKQIASADSENWQFCSYQACEHVARLASSKNTGENIHCRWGHDFEAARIVAIWMYWVHTALACRQGARGKVQRRDDVYVWVPLQPDLGTLHDLKIIDNGAVEGFTFHNHKVVLPWDVYQHFSDRHERRAQILEDCAADGQWSEEGELSVNAEGSEGSSPRLRKAASWSSLVNLQQASKTRKRSNSTSV